MKPAASSHALLSNRRHFLKTTAVAAGALAFGVPTLLRAANLNSKLNIASIGVMGKGQSDTNHCSGENIIALCDVDRERCAPQLKDIHPPNSFKITAPCLRNWAEALMR